MTRAFHTMQLPNPLMATHWRLLHTLFFSAFISLCFQFEVSAAPDANAQASATTYLSKKNLYYGNANLPDKELQALDIYWQDNRVKRPVIIYVHGGGWAFGDKSEVNSKPDFFVPQGIAFISMNYRLRWDYKLYDQLEDIASVIAWVKTHADEYGLDEAKIILMGHEAGAHLVSLLSTDERYLKAQGMSLTAIKATVAIDTLSYDVPRVMKELGSFIQRRQHRLIFGENVQVQREASPIFHVNDNKFIPQFALLYVPENEETRIQTQAFAKALSTKKVNVIMIPGNAKTKQTLDVELGLAGDLSTIALIAFLRAAL